MVVWQRISALPCFLPLATVNLLQDWNCKLKWLFSDSNFFSWSVVNISLKIRHPLGFLYYKLMDRKIVRKKTGSRRNLSGHLWAEGFLFFFFWFLERLCRFINYRTGLLAVSSLGNPLRISLLCSKAKTGNDFPQPFHFFLYLSHVFFMRSTAVSMNT